MEAAIVGMIGLGGLYAIASQEKKENFQSTLPNTNIPPQNYPVLNQKDLKHSVQDYPNANVATDKYFDQSNYDKQASEGTQLMSLTGNEIDGNNFKHNNMVPFFGGKIRGGGPDLNQSEGIMDNMIGTGSQQIRKKEQGPLFRPEDNVQHAHGAPNFTDFYQSRVNPSMKMSNIKPWEEERVGPGLNKGYSSQGDGGFNSGMAARDKWLPKTVDELRVDTNPKLTFGLANHEGPANSLIKETGKIGEVSKYRPDTYYVNGPDRYLTTTGLEKGQTSRGIEQLKQQNRQETTTQYEGIAKSNLIASKAPENYQEPKTRHIYGEAIGPAMGNKKHADYGKNGVDIKCNNRTTTRQSSEMGGIGGIIGAVVAPIMDALRPSRKENVIGNPRSSGNVQNARNKYVHNPNDKTKTTMRETMENSLEHLNINSQKGGNAYNISDQQPTFGQRDTTSCQEYGNPGAGYSGVFLEDAYRRQRNNNNKTTVAANVHGNSSHFNNKINMSLAQECSENPRMWVPSNAPNSIPSVEQRGVVNNHPQSYDQQYNNERINPNLLSAFKQNPYTQSLHSVA
jgi:hypothetical protein